MYFWSSGGGASLFDPYSLYHIVFFFAITTVLYPVFNKNVIWSIISITITWEAFEEWIVSYIPNFPFVGAELAINKWVGDPISNLLGYFIAILIINIIRKNENEQRKKTGLEKGT
jgi:hypothetical protein